jgi:hypothetical protein
VRPGLHDDSIGTRAHLCDDPVTGLLRGRSARHAWTEIHLGFGISQGRAATEGGGSTCTRRLRRIAALSIPAAGRCVQGERNDDD